MNADDDDRESPCVDGIHEVVEALAPVDLGDCVNIDYVCADCHVVVWSVSWTKVAWLAARAKAAARVHTNGSAVTR